MPKKPVAVTLRKPQAPVDIDSFVAGPSGPAPARRTAPENPLEAVSVVKNGVREYREMTLYFPPEVARQLSFYCMDKNCDVNRVVADAVSKHVSPADAAPAAEVPESWDRALQSALERYRVAFSALWAFRPWGA
jgi:hypothetical protein